MADYAYLNVINNMVNNAINSVGNNVINNSIAYFTPYIKTKTLFEIDHDRCR